MRGDGELSFSGRGSDSGNFERLDEESGEGGNGGVTLTLADFADFQAGESFQGVSEAKDV